MVQLISLLIALILIDVCVRINAIREKNSNTNAIAKAEFDKRYLRDIYYMASQDRHVQNYSTKPKTEIFKTLKVLDS